MCNEDIADDSTIPPEELLWHRIFPKTIHCDPSTSLKRPRSGSLFKSDNPLSVDISSLTNLEDVKNRGPGMAIAEFPVSLVREAGCKIVRDPIPAGHPTLPENPAHANVLGNHKHGGPTQNQARKIARGARIIFDPSSP